MRTFLGILLRYGLVWAINALSLLVATSILPGFRFDTTVPHWWTVILTLPITFAVLIILLRPLLVLLTLPLNAITLGIPTLFFNGLLLYLAAVIEGRLIIDNLLDAFIGLAIVTFVSTSLVGLLGIDETYPFFQSILTRLARRYGQPPPKVVTRGLLLLQIDGLSHRSLSRALARGRMPGLYRLLSRESHVLWPWCSGLPSNTPAVQAGLFYGWRGEAPGYRWYDRDARRVREASNPEDLRLLEARAAAGPPGATAPLLAGGSCINSFFSGGAAKRLLTVAALRDPDSARRKVELRDFQLFWLSPYEYAKAIIAAVWDILTALFWSVAGRLSGRRLRVRRNLRHTIIRAIANAFLRETAYFMVRQDVVRGVPIVFSNFVGYDEVAHYSGPDAYEAHISLAAFDRKLRRLLRVIRHGAPIAYDVVLFSDHGQSASVPFKQLYGRPLEAVVADLAGGEVPKAAAAPLGSQYVGLLLEEMRASHAAEVRRAAGRSQRTLERLARPVDGEGGAAEKSTLVVCASGCLAHVYSEQSDHRLDLDEVRALHPGLVEGLASHPGVAFVVARQPAGRVIAIGAEGVRDLVTGDVRGERDPLAPYPDRERWARELVRLSAVPQAGDLIINGAWLLSQRVVVFEDQISSHGGLGGPQTEPFLVAPASWGIQPADLESPEALHARIARVWGKMRG